MVPKITLVDELNEVSSSNENAQSEGESPYLNPLVGRIDVNGYSHSRWVQTQFGIGKAAMLTFYASLNCICGPVGPSQMDNPCSDPVKV